jgi:hypothetical protein
MLCKKELFNLQIPFGLSSVLQLTNPMLFININCIPKSIILNVLGAITMQ